MRNLYGNKNIRVKTFYTSTAKVEEQLNKFLIEYDGKIFDVIFLPTDEIRGMRVFVLYESSGKE